MRAACKIIDTNNLTHNLGVLAALAPNSQCIAVVKANAYGSEATQIYSVLHKADLLAVAAIEEAVELRDAGADKSILLLEGVFEPTELPIAFANNFEIVIATPEQLNWVLAFEHVFSRIWFKLDTGMGRLGFTQDTHETADKAMQKLLSKYEQQHIVIMTHFSSADSPNRSKTLHQIERFDDFASNYPDCQQSLCGSAGVLAYPEAHRDFIRPGIALYGASPFAGNYGEDHDLKPVMTLATKVLSVKHLRKDDTVGYADTYCLAADGYVAICQIGYADGYLRSISSGAPILINDCEYEVIGRVSMDTIAVLVNQDVKVGDDVTCWGKNLPVERVCEAADTIAYQLLTTVTERPKKLIK